MYVALVIEHAKSMRHVVICGLSGCTCFSKLSHKWHDFGGNKVTELKICFDFLYKFCLKLLSFQEELSEI